MIAARFLLSGALVLLMGGAATAQDFQPKQKGLVMLNVRASGVLTDADGSIRTAVDADSGLKAKVGDDVMPTIGLTYFFTDHLAVEAIAGTTQHEVKAVGPGVDVPVHKTWVLPPVVSLQYHFAPDARISPYVGAGLNYMLFYSDKNKNGFTVKVDDGVGYALQAGVNVKMKNRWLLNADVKKVYFSTDAKINGGALKAKVDLDPVVASIGLSRQF